MDRDPAPPQGDRRRGRRPEAARAAPPALRLSLQGTGTIDNLGGWPTTVVGRISLAVLRSGRTRPEVALDDRLPEFTVTLDDAPAPDDLVALGDSVGLALLTVLDSLRPDVRRAASPRSPL